jgi:hypothetical protein
MVDLVLTKHDGTLLGVEVQGSSHAGRKAALHHDEQERKAIHEAGMDYAEVVAEASQWEAEAERLLSLL